MIDDKPTLTSVINKHLDKRLGAVAKGLPGNVVSYDEDSETATIRLGVFRLVPSLTNSDLDEVEQVPDLFNVPVAWPRARGYALVGSLSAGDPVAVHGLDRDISGWRRSNKASEPDDARTHGWSAAFAVPGLQADVGQFPVPSDAAALASRLDALIKLLRGAASAGVGAGDTGWAAFLTALGVLFPSMPAGVHVPFAGDTTTGSAILKLEE